MKNNPRSVEVKHLRPAELEAAIREQPIVYIPFGVVEWHGPHLPLGMDTFAVEATVRHAAEKHGGLVWPTLWFHTYYASTLPMMRELFERLYATGFRVLVVASVHNGSDIVTFAEKAAQNLLHEKKISLLASCVGLEIQFGDHAAKNETSYMLHTNPDDVDLSTLDGKKITLDMSPPLGIGGAASPLEANAEDGRKAVEAGGDFLGREALRLLNEMSPEQRAFPHPEISPEYWWYA